MGLGTRKEFGLGENDESWNEEKVLRRDGGLRRCSFCFFHENTVSLNAYTVLNF